MVRRGSYLMSLFILILLFSSKAAFARVSHFSETKQKKGRELLKMNNIHLAKKIGANDPIGSGPSIP
ncbi:PREDICTED: PRUPE_4G129100 [Prunus dulcis]|uniref:PREDICTED: PRUPE_4G129100 n=1 Tax=Prunus dulcis TaxID=3755 RepID=A0A5E4FJQ3_PRUDU|nr:PREDICTED: PRUPE_4G129100 [Prunus dulcis]